jgi:hypothetical protein
MAKRPEPIEEGSAQELPELAMSPDKVGFVIMKVREFDAKQIVTEADAGSNRSDDKMIAAPEDHGDHPVVEELTSLISGPSEDGQIDLVALAWLGRDDNTIGDWRTLPEQAAGVHSTRTAHTANYLLGMPLVSDDPEEALSLFGLSCDDFEINRL